MWDALGRQVAGRNYPPTNKNTLIRALTEEWDKSPQQLLDNVVQKASRHAWHLRCMEQRTISKIPGVSRTHPVASTILPTKSSGVATGIS
ncbi:hypothetical protein TNCV_3257291 [Trichonephila clavipes]|nr:hypothetical protein TNCV_3257291 [Trichonephila clavipes]